MSKFIHQKKKLIEDVFEKASNETTEKSFSGILKSLETNLWEDFKIKLSYKSFETYYNILVQNNDDYNIKTITLDDLSTYLGYSNFREYCAEWKIVEHTVKESISKVVIQVINKPFVKLPEYLAKQSNLGIVGVLLFAGFLGNKYLINNEDKTTAKTFATNKKLAQTEIAIEKEPSHSTTIKILVPSNENSEKINMKENQCMYWDGQKYIPENCNSTQQRMVALDMKLVDNFKKITTPDTITEKSIQKIWYSKSNNKIEFFTSDGENPENGKELKHVTKYIWTKYIFNKIDSD